ncbi:MAG: hypothetical protein HFH13_06660 [Dorea sp.]|jgi:hypothetical protein|nr:hypothetical protein [Dorea sp.]
MKKTMKKVLSGMLVFIFLLNFAILPANAEEYASPDIGTAEKIGQSEGEETALEDVGVPEGLVERIEGMESLPKLLERPDDGVQAYSGEELQCKPEEWEVLYLTNFTRMYLGIEPLSMMMNMQAAANVRANELPIRFEHVRPDGTGPETALAEQGVYYNYAGENIAQGQLNAYDVWEDWLESPGHLANMITEEYTHLGVGYSEDGPSWVQLFTGSCTPTSISIYQGSNVSYLMPPGRSIDDIGLALQVECEHGTSFMPIMEEMCSDFDSNLYEKQAVTVTYKGLTAQFNVLPCEALPFTDVTEDAWFYGYVMEIYHYGIMTGLTYDTFGPGEELSRGQFATILYRMSGEEPKVPYQPVFSDVPDDGAFYKDAAIWAWATDVITGYEDGSFGPADQITREQMATMLYRYAGKVGEDVSSSVDLGAFPDSGNVSDFAWDAMSWAVATGLISGEGADGSLNPQGNASRAVCATIMSRFINNVISE